MKSALIIIDVQNAMLAENPYRHNEMMTAIHTLLSTARQHCIEVIHVRHNTDNGPLQTGSPSWQIANEVAPLAEEKIFDKRYNSAFKDTGLLEHLRAHQTEQLIIVGMQTEYCIETSVRVAFEYGFSVIVPEGSNSTFDNGCWSAQMLYEHHNHDIIRNRFAQMPSIKETVAILSDTPNHSI